MISYGPYNLYTYFISPNPITSFNQFQLQPKIDSKAFISPFVSIIGDVTISNNVYIAPNVSIRADEGTPFYIGQNTNIQDGVVLHGLLNKKFIKDNKYYSIYIGDNVSCAHGSIIHGPCIINNNVFIGFNSIVFNAIIGEGVFISSNSIVTNGVTIEPNKFVPPGASIDSQEKANMLNLVPEDKEEFSKEVLRVNSEFPYSYSILLGKNRCSCGMACD